MNFIITIFSKNKNSIKNFFKFLNEELALDVNYITIISNKNKKKTFKTISILKSPHVNKKAQVHYGLTSFSKHIFVYSNKVYKTVLFFKKIKSYLFPDIKIEIKFLVSSKSNIFNTKSLSPSKFVLGLKNFNTNIHYNKLFFKKPRLSPIEKVIMIKKKSNLNYKVFFITILKYLQVWDCYGELIFVSFKKI